MFGLDDLKQTRYFQDVMEEGSLKTAREDILYVLEIRFANRPSDYIQKLNKIEEPSVLKALLNRAVTAQNIAEFQQSLQEVTGDN